MKGLRKRKVGVSTELNRKLKIVNVNSKHIICTLCTIPDQVDRATVEKISETSSTPRLAVPWCWWPTPSQAYCKRFSNMGPYTYQKIMWMIPLNAATVKVIEFLEVLEITSFCSCLRFTQLFVILLVNFAIFNVYPKPIRGSPAYPWALRHI